MPPEPGSPAEWLRYARSDLALASLVEVEGVLPDALCFHAQQAAEKALKAVLIAQAIEFPRTHDLAVLLDLMPDAIPVPDRIEECDGLSVYAAAARYPRGRAAVTEAEHHQAVAIAAAVVAWAETVMGEKPAPLARCAPPPPGQP